jgi:glucose/arabinose dehydrogenase
LPRAIRRDLSQNSFFIESMRRGIIDSMPCVRWVTSLVIVILLTFANAAPRVARAQSSLPALAGTVVATGLTFPLAFIQDPSDPRVQFIVEQFGRIRILRDGVLLADDFLNLSGQIAAGGEQGLLGLAFAPDYATSRRFFVNFTNPSGHTVIARYQRSSADPLRADAASRFDLRWPDGNRFIIQPFANHNGGDLHFGSDGYLYIAMGDGGSGNDPGHLAQSPATLLGKMLRIDVSVAASDPEGYDVPGDNPFVGQPGVLPEIWAFGLRNPFRFTVDALERGGNGALLIGDVGQNSWEEIDYEPFGAGGRNYGWRNREGAHDNVTSLPPAFLPLVDPIIEYDRTVGTTVIGGVVNRGTSLGAAFFGRYFYADFGNGRVWSVRLLPVAGSHEVTASDVVEHTTQLGATGNVSSFGIDASCRIHLLDFSGGRVLRMDTAAPAATALCAPPDPFLSLGGGVFVDGVWVLPGNCTTPLPATGWVCVNGGWVPPDHPLATGGGSTPSPPPPPPPAPTSACTSPKPAADWVCVNGGWLPPGHPLATGGGSTPSPPPPPPAPSSACTSPKPGADWVCVNGGWVPPGHPLAGGGG